MPISRDTPSTDPATGSASAPAPASAPASAPGDDDALARAVAALRARGRILTEPTPMAGDVSRRRYLRARLRTASDAAEDRSAVLALYPPDLTGVCTRTLRSTRLLHEAGIRVPAVLEADCAPDGDRVGGGWTLLEDLGRKTLYDWVDRPWDHVRPFFLAAVDDVIPRLEALDHPAVSELSPPVPPLDAALLSRELAMTRRSFLAPRGLDVDDRLWEPLEELCRRLGAEPPSPCHRDFGARNLIPFERPDGTPDSIGVLDHQDVRLGPPRYDLASLLNDSLFPPPEGEEELLGRAGAATGRERERYHRAAAQRTLKAVGSYAAFAARGGTRHLGLIGPTLDRALRHLARTPETAAVAPRLAALWTG